MKATLLKARLNINNELRATRAEQWTVVSYIVRRWITGPEGPHQFVWGKEVGRG